MSQWCTPVMILRKSGSREGITNQCRFISDRFPTVKCVDKNFDVRATVPLIREIIKQLSSAKIFSASDVVGGFYQQTLVHS